MKNLRRYAIPLLIFLIAFVMRVALEPIPFYSAQPIVPEQVAPDGYLALAENMIAGHGFTSSDAPPYVPESQQTPLYPSFVAAVFTIFGSFKAVFLIQAVIGSLTAVLAYIIAKEFLSPRFAAAAGFLAALEPYTAYLAGMIFTETLFFFLFLCALYVLFQYLKAPTATKIFCAGLLLGIAGWVKPAAQFLPLALVLVMWIASVRDKRSTVTFLKHAAILLGTFVLVLSPWLIRNYQTFGTAQMSDAADKNFYGYLAPSVIALDQGISYEEAAQPYFARNGVREGEVNFGNAHEMRAIAQKEIAAHPIGLLKSALITQWAFFTHDAYSSMLQNLGYSVSYAHPPLSQLLAHPTQLFAFLSQVSVTGWISIMGRIFWIATTLLALIGALVWIRVRGITPALLLMAGVIAYFALVTIIVGLGVIGRYRVPVEPFIFIFALYALETVFDKRPDSNQSV